MHILYVACLVGGVIATVIFAVLGRIGMGGGHGHSHVSHRYTGHGHVGHTHSGAHTSQPAPPHGPGLWLSASSGWVLSWLSPLVLAAAAFWFGGIGLLAARAMGRGALLVAVDGGILGAWLVRAAMAALERSSSPELSLTAEGALGTVNATIRADAPGEVLYTLEGLHRSVAAKSIDGTSIPRGAAVVIVRREGGFAWVEALDALQHLDADTARSADSSQSSRETE